MLTSAAPDARASARNERHQLNAAFLTVCAVASTIGVIGAWSARSEHLQWEPLSGPIVTAIRACPGHLYNRFDDGGYLIWFAPGVPVFVDNRQDPYPLAFLQDHLHHERSGDFEPVFARYALRCAFLPPESPTAQHLISSGQWSVTARDARWLVLRAR